MTKTLTYPISTLLLLCAVHAAEAAVYVGFGEIHGYISSGDGVFDVRYTGTMQVEFDTRYDTETSTTEVMVNLTSLQDAEWYSGESSGSSVISLSTGSFVQPTSGAGGSGELYDPFHFDIHETTSTSLFLSPEWAIDGDDLDLFAVVETDPFARGGPVRLAFTGRMVPVPEPTALLVLGPLLAAVGVRRRRRRRSRD